MLQTVYAVCVHACRKMCTIQMFVLLCAATPFTNTNMKYTNENYTSCLYNIDTRQSGIFICSFW